MSSNFTNERLVFALLLGAGAGFLVAQYLIGDYQIALIIVGSAVAIALETTLRVNKERKEIESLKTQGQARQVARLKPPKSPFTIKPPKPPRGV